MSAAAELWTIIPRTTEIMADKWMFTCTNAPEVPHNVCCSYFCRACGCSTEGGRLTFGPHAEGLFEGLHLNELYFLCNAASEHTEVAWWSMLFQADFVLCMSGPVAFCLLQVLWFWHFHLSDWKQCLYKSYKYMGPTETVVPLICGIVGRLFLTHVLWGVIC